MKDGSNGRIEEQKRLETKKKRHLNCRCKSNYINPTALNVNGLTL